MLSLCVRYIAAAAILTAGACTTAMNWRFSYQLGTTEWDSTIWAIFSVALDVAKWVMLSFAAAAGRRHKLRALAAFSIWFIATAYSFTAAIGFAAFNRDGASADRQQRIELQKTIAMMKQSARWQSSAACADASAPRTKEFCAVYAATEARLKGLAQDADPQATLLAKLTGLGVDAAQLVLSVWLAVACEVISAFGFYAILQSKADTTEAALPPPAPWTRPAWSQNLASRSDTSWQDTSRRVTTHKK